MVEEIVRVLAYPGPHPFGCRVSGGLRYVTIPKEGGRGPLQGLRLHQAGLDNGLSQIHQVAVVGEEDHLGSP